MMNVKITEGINTIITNMPSDWLALTTHRLDIYQESLAKTEFIEHLEKLFQSNNLSTEALKSIPTAYDYIRLGHPLSCVLEWAVAHLYGIHPKNVISFSSKTTPILAILRKNLLLGKKTRILVMCESTLNIDTTILNEIYGYQFKLEVVRQLDDLQDFDGSTLLISENNAIGDYSLNAKVDFYLNIHHGLGSILLVHQAKNEDYVSEIQHVRRRETIAMTPSNCLEALTLLIGRAKHDAAPKDLEKEKAKVLATIQQITESPTKPLVGSSGLSIQFAIMMGLIDHAQANHPGKEIKFVVPPNCYGGTNDQARRIAACRNNVEILDLLVDGENDMVQGMEQVLTQIAHQDAIGYIIAEIPTNPRVEVPDLNALRATLLKERYTITGERAIEPVFILDQTFCPNVHFLGKGRILADAYTISYASGSKFPSGGKCTAGYCVGSEKTKELMQKIEFHLSLCDNEATALQYEILATQMPSMNQRITDAYQNTRTFVNFIQKVLPDAKINFVSEELAAQGFTPSVFSLDLPTKGETAEERENYKRALNLRLINKMIQEIPNESKYCVSYGQLKGCYWTIPATSTQGTTKEDDKDYIARVALSPQLDLNLHMNVFQDFVNEI